MTNSSPDATALERWLAHRHHDFVQGLAERFDLSAGLREVQLADRHTGLIDGLAAKLDIEAGLAAIVPISAPAPETALDDLDEGSPEWAATELDVTPLPLRLSIRAAYADKLGAAAHEALRHSTRTEEHQAADDGTIKPEDARIGQFREQFEMLVPPALAETDSRLPIWEVDYRRRRRRRPYWLAVNPDQLQFDLDLGENREEENRLETQQRPDTDGAQRPGTWIVLNTRDDLANSATYWTDAVRNFVLRTLNDLEMQAYTATDSLIAVAGYLHQYERLLNDFTGADLRDIDLAGVPLEGLRWSAATTHWPDSWREQIERDSIPVDDDVYEIHYGTKAHQDTLV